MQKSWSHGQIYGIFIRVGFNEQFIEVHNNKICNGIFNQVIYIDGIG